ncbi:MAG TPA: stalk domain-containing protein [Tissierellaceae bacterium]|nr:stalk domain-containing protein [Tissierellaceae bacterium]
MKKNYKIISVMTLILILLIFSACNGEAANIDEIALIVNGKDITSIAKPVIRNGRTLVPLRFVTEEIGGEVAWDNGKREVSIKKNDKNISLVIDKKIIQYDNKKAAMVSDIAPIIIDSRTFVPLRLVGNLLDIDVRWDNNTRRVIVDSNKASAMESLYDIKITSHGQNSIIDGKTTIKVDWSKKDTIQALQLRLLLLNKNSLTGFIVGRADIKNKEALYIPEIEDNGDKILVAASYDTHGNMIEADAIAVKVDVKPQITLQGLQNGMSFNSDIKLTPALNFAPYAVKYQIKNLNTGKVVDFDEKDPQGEFVWSPNYTDNGELSIQIFALDNNKKQYPGSIYNVSVSIPQKLSLSGIKEGMTINSPVILNANRNFDVRETQYILRDINTGAETILKTLPYGGYTWFPEPSISGSKEVLVRVIDASGKTITSSPVKVKIDGKPIIQLQGVGPNQVVTEKTKLTYRTNVNMTDIKFTITGLKTGNKVILDEDTVSNSVSFDPSQYIQGNYRLAIEGVYNGAKIIGDSVDFSIYNGTIYGPYSIIEKSQFINFAGNMAKESYKKTGMSAALQTAQAILETGWGQSVPSDKYNGKKSNNLFGIKGSSTNGSVVSHTWEVYNGIRYNVDANFRAYKNPKESWNDHKALLLNAERYGVFRDVMYNSNMGAWAIRRAGYATDPAYPLKLLKIIKDNNLKELDRVGL